ncbi:hypothetical protein [Chondrinema litorale]|uniref:hypothetical protein n=1 Tax=Chondrinema litorale TaxID=2994555 RepID=UPI002543B799|nr:hypothetical protein [Chondrinema litorale]UZR92372.1 hypothetical protein OQ292_10920 [Chondrinema litorale]
MHWYIALPAALLLIFACISFLKSNKNLKDNSNPISGKYLLAIALLSLLVTVYSGIGGYTNQLIDFEKHNAVLFDLINNKWPVFYHNHQYIKESVFLDYYLGWYLPPALLAKITSIYLTEFYSFAWSFLGLFLSIYWFLKIGGVKNWWAIFLFFLFGDLESVYTVIRFFTKSIFVWNFDWNFLLKELYLTDIIFANFSSNYACQMTQYEWAPQHSLGAWVGTGIILQSSYLNKDNRFILLLGSLTLLWSPFVSIGLIPIILLSVSRNIKSVFTWENFVAGLCLFIIMAVYYIAHYPQDFRWIWEMYKNSEGLYKVPLFIIVKFGIVLICIYPFIKNDKEFKPLFFVVFISLSLIPFIYIGHQADFAMRASSPSWYILVILVVMSLKSITRANTLKYLYYSLILLSCTRYIIYGKYHTTLHELYNLKVSESNRLTNLYDLEWFNTQYFGRMESLFMKYFAKEHE